MADENQTTNVILPTRREPVAYGDWKRAIEQINAELRSHDLALAVHTVDGCFVVERLPHD